MKIVKMNVTKPFNYLWLKTVESVDLNVHCAKCLVGSYYSNISNKEGTLENLQLENKIHYLCGVARPWNWNNNFHLAFMPSVGDTVRYSSNGIEIEIEDAIALPISEEFIDYGHSKAHLKSYYTCRNWQFANYLNQHQELF